MDGWGGNDSWGGSSSGWGGKESGGKGFFGGNGSAEPKSSSWGAKEHTGNSIFDGRNTPNDGSFGRENRDSGSWGAQTREADFVQQPHNGFSTQQRREIETNRGSGNGARTQQRSNLEECPYFIYCPVVQIYEVLQRNLQANTDLAPDSQAAMSDMERIILPMAAIGKQIFICKRIILVGLILLFFVLPLPLFVWMSDSADTVWFALFFSFIIVMTIGYYIPDLIVHFMEQFDFGKNKSGYYKGVEKAWSIATGSTDIIVLACGLGLAFFLFMFQDDIVAYVAQHLFSQYSFAYLRDSVSSYVSLCVWYVAVHFLITLFYKIGIRRKIEFLKLSHTKDEKIMADVDECGDLARGLGRSE